VDRVTEVSLSLAKVDGEKSGRTQRQLLRVTRQDNEKGATSGADYARARVVKEPSELRECVSREAANTGGRKYLTCVEKLMMEEESARETERERVREREARSAR